MTAATRRAGPLFGALLVVVGMTVAITPVVPGAAALDPTPSPDATTAAASDSPAPAPDPSVAPDPSPAPSADPTVAPTAAPTTSPDPTPTPVASIDPVASPDPSPSASPDPSASPTASPVAAAGVSIDHYWVDQENRAGDIGSYGEIDTPRDLMRFTVYRLRFQVVNAGDTSVTVTPKLMSGTGADPSAWTLVPEVDPVDGEPFYAASDKGSTWDVRHGTLAADRLRLDRASDPGATPVDGIASAGENPAPALTLPAHSYTEIQFAFRATLSAQFEHAYTLRLALGADADVTSRVDAPAPMAVTPDPATDGPAASGKPYENPPTAFRLNQPTLVTASLASATVQPASGFALSAGAFTSPHALLDTLTSDACAACHAAHTGQADQLLRQASPIASVCFTCHDGTGANADIAAQFAGAAANDPATDSWYQHPATQNDPHLNDQDIEEFKGVTNRHAQCADCHQPHLSDATKSSATATGWLASGAIKGASGVAVTNGAANSTPTFSWQKTSTYEYQLCFKCHSGYTTLTGWNATNPSRSQLDKSVELNPANVSYHPVEAAGKNTSTQINASLNNASSFRLWSGLTSASVIRCANCHSTSSATAPASDATLDNHASANRGILIRAYQDRTLLGSSTSYSASRFALCFACHATAPFSDTFGLPHSESKFATHGLHSAGLQGNSASGAGTSIDHDGDGLGNALCAECHFNQHGTSFPANSGAGEGAQGSQQGLVNFAPNVQPFNGVIRYAPNGSGVMSCTLTCHGKQHDRFTITATGG